MAPPITVEAVVLSTTRYGETSRIARLATRELGVVSAIAKGALRPKSRIGSALQPLSLGQGIIIPSRHSDLHLLTSFDVVHAPLGLGAALERWSAALALVELMLRFAPADPHHEGYEALRDGLLEVEHADPDDIDAVGLRRLWDLIARLGFAPALQACVIDGLALSPEGPLPFSAREGGALCPTCARTHPAAMLPAADRADLVALLSADAPLPRPAPANAAAHRRLLVRFVRHQLGGDHPLPALDFWERRGWNDR